MAVKHQAEAPAAKHCVMLKRLRSMTAPGFQWYAARIVAFIAASLVSTATACHSAAPSTLEKMDNDQPRTSTAAFTASRHPDTTDTQNPYRVEVHELVGPEVNTGQVVYSALNERGEKVTESQVKLRRAGSEHTWTAEIPAQPAGSTIQYYFLFSSSSGQVLRHPAREQASYRFRVVALQVSLVTFPKGNIGPAKAQPITLHVQAGSRPSGEMVLRLLPSSSDGAGERRIALSTVEEQNGAGKPAAYLMESNPPDLQPGQIANFYFQLRTSDGADLRVPADAPERVYSIKRPARLLKPLLGDDAFVLDVGFLREGRCIGLKGGGVWIGGPNNQADHWGLENGLLSGIARFVLPDKVSGRVYVGTDHGVIAIESGGASSVGVATPFASAWGAESPALKRLGTERRAGPAALSTLDGTLIFQLQREQVLETTFPTASFLQLRDDKLGELQLPALNLPVVGMSSATFDSVDGCWLIGAFKLDADQRLRPVIIRRCGEQVEQITPQDFSMGDLRVAPARIVALTRDPSTGGLAAGLELAVTDPQGRRRTDYGVYRVEDMSGKLAPVAAELATMGTEVTSLAADWRHNQMLVGTFGKGLWQVQSGVVQPRKQTSGLPGEITVIKADPDRGDVLVGTSHGAYEFSDGAFGKLPFGPRGEDPLITDALPVDQNLATGRVLLSSYSSGLFQLEREKSGDWRVIESLKAGAELPAGLFGDAQYTSSRSMVVIQYSHGLLRVENKQAKLLPTFEGLQDGNNLLRLLVRRSGDIWLAHTPSPFGQTGDSTLQIIRDDHLVRTIRIASRELATIGRWVEVPERNSVFAATRAGVVEINNSGAMTLLSTDSVSSITRDPLTGLIGVAGTAVQRWNGKRFVPILFRVDHPRLPKGQFPPGTPIDIAVDKNGLWYLLYNGGVLALLDSEGRFVKLLDPEDGIPPTARRLLTHLETGDVFVGSGNEGLVVVLSPVLVRE